VDGDLKVRVLEALQGRSRVALTSLAQRLCCAAPSVLDACLDLCRVGRVAALDGGCGKRWKLTFALGPRVDAIPLASLETLVAPERKAIDWELLLHEVSRVVRRLVPRSDAEDLLQEVLLLIVKRGRPFWVEDLAAYACGIARRLCGHANAARQHGPPCLSTEKCAAVPCARGWGFVPQQPGELELMAALRQRLSCRERFVLDGLVDHTPIAATATELRVSTEQVRRLRTNVRCKARALAAAEH
jgi:DNA-directed RNA polymerase specialized sigma24 family protein